MTAPASPFRLRLAAALLPLPLRPLLRETATLEPAALDRLRPGAAATVARALLLAPGDRPVDILVATTSGALGYHSAVPGLLLAGGRPRIAGPRIVLARAGGAPPDPAWLAGPAWPDFLHELGHLAMKRLYGYIPRTWNLMSQIMHAPETPTDGVTALVEGFALHTERMAGEPFVDWYEFAVRRGDFWRSEFACANFLDAAAGDGGRAALRRIFATARPWTFRGLARALRHDDAFGPRKVDECLERAHDGLLGE